MARETLPIALNCQERGPPISLEINRLGLKPLRNWNTGGNILMR